MKNSQAFSLFCNFQPVEALKCLLQRPHALPSAVAVIAEFYLPNVLHWIAAEKRGYYYVAKSRLVVSSGGRISPRAKIRILAETIWTDATQMIMVWTTAER